MYLDYAVRLMKQMMEDENMKYQHIIFDLDGTLIDTEQAVLKTWQHTLKDFHYFFPLEELRIVLGIPTENALKKLRRAGSGIATLFADMLKKLAARDTAALRDLI